VAYDRRLDCDRLDLRRRLRRDRRAAAATTGLRLDLHALGFGFAVEGANRSSTRMAERRSLQHQPPEIKVFPFSLAFAFDCDLFQTESEIAKVNWRTPTEFLTSLSLGEALMVAASRAMRRAGAILFSCVK
jgi:hypothetical protein